MTTTLSEAPSIETVKLPAHGSPDAENAVYEGLLYLKTRWDLNNSEVARLLRVPPTTLAGWLQKERVPVGKPPFDPTIEAVIHLLAVHRSLDAMFSEPAHQAAWLTTPHPELSAAPIKLMEKSTEGLVFVRRYLDYVRGRGA